MFVCVYVCVCVSKCVGICVHVFNCAFIISVKASFTVTFVTCKDPKVQKDDA